MMLRWFGDCRPRLLRAAAIALIASGAGAATAADQYTARDLSEAARLVSRVHILKPELSTLPTESAEAFSAALKALDPFSELISASRLPMLKEEKARARGLGGVFEVTKSGTAVLIPLPGGPAERAGLDEPIALTRLGDLDIAGKSVAEIEALVAGKQVVKVEGRGLRTDGTRAVSITVDGFALEGASVSNVAGIDVIRIDFFIRGETASRVTGAVERARLAGRPVMIDLRYSTGGDLEEAVKSLSALGLGGVGSIVESNEGKREELTYLKSGEADAPSIYIAVSHLTASAAEVFAGTLLEEGRALLIGETTFGKCLAQRLFELPDGAAIRVSTGRLFFPSGAQCETNGLSVDLAMDKSVHDLNAVVARARSAGQRRICAMPAKGEVLPGAATLGGKVWRGKPGERQCVSPAVAISPAQAAEQLLRVMDAKVWVETLFSTAKPSAQSGKTSAEKAKVPVPKPKQGVPAKQNSTAGAPPLSTTTPPALVKTSPTPTNGAVSSTTPSSIKKKTSLTTGGWYFILSLHPTVSAANVAASTAKSIAPGAPIVVEPVKVGALSRHQVVVGPFANRAAAQSACQGKDDKALSSTCDDTEIYFRRDAKP